MVKTYIVSLIIAITLFLGAILGDLYIKNQFNEFNQTVCVLYRKITDETATADDVYSLQTVWIDKKKTLHAFISHTEIKEMDLWIAECASLVKDNEWTDAVSKIEVIRELSEQIPKSFSFSVENIL